MPKGRVAITAQEARNVAEDLGGESVVKAQVHAGGRGKSGGIKVVSSAADAEQVAASMLDTKLITEQTRPEGVPVHSVLVEEVLRIESELYVSMVVDGAVGGVVAIASEAGGVDIEEVATQSPEKICRVEVDPMLGLQSYQGRSLAYDVNVKPELVRPFAALLANLYRIFEANDCSLAEINPLVITTDDKLLAADAKLSFDDDALYRHHELAKMRDIAQEEELEAQAREYGISYVKLDGEVGCIVNGAGLAMATMDITGDAGAAPANFLDVGGGADEDKVARALDIILSDPNVESVLVNIFGGILRCDVVARGLLMAAEAIPHAIRPMVVRMLGTNAEEGRKLLADSGLDVTLVNDFTEAAEAIKSAS